MQHSSINHHTISRHDNDMYDITTLHANIKLQTTSQSKYMYAAAKWQTAQNTVACG